MSRAKSAIARLLGTTDPEVIKKVGEVVKKQATERDHIEASDATTYKTRPIQVVPKEYDQAKKAEAEARKRDEAEAKSREERYAILNKGISDIVAMSPEEKDAYYQAYDKALTEESEYQWQKQQEAQAMRSNQLKAQEDYIRGMAELEDFFEQNEKGNNFFSFGNQNNFKGLPLTGNNPRKYRDMLDAIERGKAEGKAKADQEREELRQRMQLLKDNPEAWAESLEKPLQLIGKWLPRDIKTEVDGTPYIERVEGVQKKVYYLDKNGNEHPTRMAMVQANDKIDTQQQYQDIMEFATDPMALQKTMREVEAEIERLGKARDAAAQKYGSEHPFLSLLSGAKGTKSLDPWLEGAYGPEAQSITLELEKAFAKLDNLKNIEKKIKSGELPRGGFWNGVGQMGQAVADKVTDRSWGMYEGMSNMLSESEKQIVFDKIAKGEPLTASEMQWATIDLLEGKVNTEVDSPYLYNITSGLMESAPYMRDIFLSPGKGISGAFVNWGKSRYGATGFLKLVGNALQGAATTATVGANELVSGTSERMRGDLSFGENGLEVTGQKSLGRALTQQFASQTASNMVELMGVPLLDKAGKYIGKAVKEVADGLSYGKASKVLSAMDKSSAVNWVNGVRKSMGIHDLPVEIGEEYVDAFAQSIVEGEDQLSPMLNTEEFLNIAGTCGLMSAIFGSANVAGFAGEFHKVNREYKKAKQEVLRQFSSDVWASLDNLITNAQDEDLTVRLADAIDGMAMNQEQRSAIMNYLAALKRYQKFNELNDGGKFIIGGPQQTQATQSTSTSTYEIDSDITLKDEIGNPIDAHIIGRDANGNYMVESSQPINGKRVQPLSADQLDAMVIPNTPDGIQQSEVDGYNLTDANQQAEVSMLTDNARESVATLLGVTPDAVDATLQQVLGDNPTDAKIEARFGNNAQVVKDYMYNVAKTKGMSARLIDDIADATAESDRAIDAVDNNGNVVTAKDVNGNDVNVVSGNIVTYEDGLIDTNNSDSSVVIRHADGTTEMVAPTSLTEVVSMPTEQAKATQAQAIAQQMQQTFADAMSGALDYSQGQQYTMLNADGSTTDVTILADNGDGNVTVTARDGNKEGGVTDGKQIVLPKSQIQQGVREFKRNQLRGETAQQASIPQAESQPTEVAEPTMPTDEQGNIMYEQMDADSAWDALLAETGGDADMAMTVANEMIADKAKAVEEASKMVAQPGATPQEKIANLKAVKQAQVQAQAELDAWKAIAETPNRRMSLQTEQTDLQTDLQTELQGQQVAGKLPASEEVGPTETTPVEEVAQIEESAPIEEQTKGNASTMSQETDQVSDQVEEEKDVIEELRERNRVGNERDQRAGRPPRPSDYIEAIGKGDDKAMKAWEGEFNDYAQKLNADDLPDIESTIRQMQGHIDTIRSGNPKGYKDNSAYKAYSGIKKMLEKRRRELDKQSAEDNTRLSAMSGVGLVEDARTRTLGDKTRKTLDAMAKRLGLQVEFVDEIVTGKDDKGNNTYANADIVGNKVRIAWDKRDQALDFLLGHEFTHRMQNLSPEAYAEFVEATKQALGEKEWNKRINRMKSLYKQHSINISEQGIIDEVVADYAGELVEERGVFDNFVERNKDNRGLLSTIADVLRSIKEFFTLGKQRKINNAIARLEALIESASEANLRGDVVSSKEQRNSLIGEQGATALDKAEEATHRMDNLAVARDMEAEGKDAKAIRMATGWERGADGKWRYEIEDIGEIETPDEAIARMEKERRAIEKDRERLDYVVYQRLPRNATEEQKAKMKELRKRHKELVKKSSELWNAIYDKSNSKLGVHLSEYIGNDNELLKAYPELRNIDVSFVENSAMINEGFNGSFNGHTIWINPYAENARSILIHEIQHAIQNIEGFAKGGNNKTADMLRDKARVWAWRNALVHTAKERPELSGTTAVEKALIEEYKEDGLEDYIPSEEQRIKGLNLYLRGYDNEGYEQAYNQMHKVMPGEDYTTYRRLAGEVESRNAQKRMDMTAEQRRETLLRETEDVAREDQIFLMENGGVSGMGSTVVKRKADIAMKLKGKDISPTQLKVVDAFATDTNNIAIEVIDANGKQRSITLKQGQDNKAGVKHSVLKHYETASNYYTAEEILLIPQIIEQGERIQNGNKVSYKAEVNGVKFTVTTEMRRGNEEFTNFFTNRKPINKSLSNTAKQHGTTSQSVSTDKGSEENSDTQENSVKAQYSLQGAFYSNAHHAVEDIKQDKATPQQWIAMLKKNGGLKAGEDKWLGLEDWLNTQQGSVTKQDIIDYINENSIKIEEVEYKQGLVADEGIPEYIYDGFEEIFNDLRDTEQYNHFDLVEETWNIYTENAPSWVKEAIEPRAYSDGTWDLIIVDDYVFANHATEDENINAINSTRLEYTTEGLEDKREIALTVPTIDPYNQSDDIHFGDADDGRAVAWIRFGETEDAEGNRVLVIDEIQSKRHQDGREKGYSSIQDLTAEQQENGIWHIFKDGQFVAPVAKWQANTPQEAVKYYARNHGVPSAPFEKNWQELAMKRMLRYATDFGFDKLAWTTGEQQAKRYGLGNRITEISVLARPDGEKIVSFDYRHAEGYQDFYQSHVIENGEIISGDFKGNNLSDVVGKELADKIIGLKEDTKMDGEDLRLGGEGMKGFYDKMLPSFMNKYGKKWGVKVGEVTMPDLEEGYQTMHSVDVTDAMREDVRFGQPLFSLQGNSLTAEEQRIVDEAKANGTYLKAPNGKQSNLNERQWIQVRTKAFKDWFGDWENDPENASKVVDENGEPKVVYHQTNKTIYRNVENGKLWDDLDWREKQEWEERDDWDEYWVEEDFYEFSRTNARTTNEFDGFFFAPEYDEYHEYGDRTIEAFLNIRKPASQADYNIDAKYNDAGKKERIRLQEEGFDGVIRMEGNEVWEYVAFEPTQIKSATDNVGTFDANNPDIRYSLFGGNSGYVGYSMSKRAARAREEGRYPKTDFRKEYGVTAKSFDELVDAKIIASGEWHHTSKFGNETKFYHWDKDYYADIYEENKAVIDKLSRERKTDEIVSLFENHPLAHKAEYDNETEWLVRDVNREYSDKIREVENEKRDKEGAYNSAVFDALGQLTNVVKANNGNLWFNASNGVGIQIDSAGNEKSMNYSNANEGNSRDALRAEARNELQTAIENIVKEGNIESVDATYYTDKVNQLEAERAERVAQLVEAREKEYTPKARYSLASDMARDEQMQSLLKNTPLWNDVAKTMSNADDYTIAVEALNRLDEDAVNSAKQAIDNANGVFAKAEATDIANRLERALQMMRSAEVSEGEANPISEKEVVNVIVDSSEIKLPTNRAEALDVVSKMKRPFINHDQNKEIIVSNKAVRHAATQDKMHKFVDVRCLGVIDKIIENAVKIGNIDVAPDEIETTHKVEVYYCPVKIDDTQYSVRILVRQLKNKGRIMEDFRMYDLAAKDKKSDVSSQGTGNESLTPLLTSDFAYKVKDLIHNSKEQDKKLLGISNKTKFSLQGGRSIADKYEKRVNTKGKGGAMHLSKFNFMEAWQDEMRALKEVQRIIEQEYGIVLESYEDAYMAENAMSSIAKASWDRYISEVYEPMMRIHDEWIRSGESNESINHYLIAKSGLERNREFTVRDAFRAERASMEESIRDAYRSAIKDLNEKYEPMELDLLDQYRSGAIDKDTYRNERKNLSDAKKAERKPIDDKYQLDMQDAHNKMTQVEEEYKAKRNALRDDLKAGNIDFAEFCRLSDDLALQYSGAEEIADYSGLTALAKIYGSKDWQGFAEQMVRDFEMKHSNTDVMWEHINNNTKAAVDYSYKSGVTSKQAKDHLDQMFLWYVPMKGNADVEAEDIYTYVNDKSSSFTPTVARAKGHTKYVSEDVMALIANTMQSAILQGERNKVKQKFLNMVQNYPTDLFSVDNGWVELQGNDWVEVFPDINENDTHEEVRSKIEDFQEKMQELANEGKAKRKSEALSLGVPFRATQNKSEHAISVMRNGEKMTIYVNGNPRVAQALNGKLKATPAWGLYETWKRWFSASKTSYSPNFIVSNASRDTGHIAMMTFVQRGLKEQLKALGTYIPAYATLVANAVDKKSPNGYKYDRYLEEFISNGGVTGYSQLYGVDKFKTDNAKRIARLKGAAKALQQGVNVVENINKIWQNINGIFENSSRFNEYIRSRNRGEDVATSVFNAKNITVNFNKKGGGAVEDSMFHQLAFVGRNWMPFFNPIVQGIYQFLKVGKEHKGRMALACLGFMGGGFLAPILNAMLVGALGGDDEDDYMKQPEWTRRNNFMIYTGDGYAKFALPQMFRELYGIGDILYCAVKGNMSAEDAAMQVVSQLRNMFSLEGQSSQKGKEWDALRFLAPDYFGAVVDIETNTNFTGAPLWKETDYNQYDPDYKKAYNNTWSWLVDFSRKVNEWTGGDEYSKGNVNNKYLTNPAVWQRLITEMGGGLTETIGDVYNTAYSLFTGQGIDKSNIPLVKRLYTETNAETLQKWIDREYYSLEGTHKYVKNRMSKLNKSSALDTADKISMMYYDRDYMIYAIYETYSKEIKELRDQAQSAPEDKKAEIQKREYDAKMKVISLIDNFNAIEDNEVEAYMANNPMVARLVGKDIIKKVGAKYKELKRNWKEAPYGSTEEKKASDALTAFEKTPEYQYYDSIRMATKAIDKKEEEIDTVLLPKNRLKIKAEIDSIKTQLVELRKAYESIGEIKE